MANHLDPAKVSAVVVVEAVTADGHITYDLDDVISGRAVEGTLRFAMHDGSVVDRPFTVPAARVLVS